MSPQHDTNAKVVNPRWEGKYGLVCDVILNEKVVTEVSAGACPPFKDAEVFFQLMLLSPETRKARLRELFSCIIMILTSESQQ
jgi:hypothetical protein